MAGFAIWSRFAGHPGRSAKTRYALRLKSDHSIGAGHGEIISKEKCNTEKIFIEGSPHTAVCMQG
jgi:hypothetical protein